MESAPNQENPVVAELLIDVKFSLGVTTEPVDRVTEKQVLAALENKKELVPRWEALVAEFSQTPAGPERPKLITEAKAILKELGISYGISDTNIEHSASAGDRGPDHY